MNRSELQKEIIKKAAADASFREEVLKNPKEAIEKAFGFKVQKDVQVKIVEEDADTVSFVLPKNTNELTDSELDNVAGGCFTDCSLCIKDFDIF